MNSKGRKSTGNVFIDLGFDAAEARVLAFRSQLMMSIEREIKTRGLSQRDAAQLLHISQPRVCDLMKGRTSKFSVDMLLVLAARMGIAADIRLAAA